MRQTEIGRIAEEYLAKHKELSIRAIARLLTADYPDLFTNLNQARSALIYVKDRSSDGSTCDVTTTVRSLDVRSLETALKKANVDLKVWEVDRWVINSWEITMGKKGTGASPGTFTNYQVKVWLKRRQSPELASALERVIKLAHERAPRKWPKTKARGTHLLEVSLFDHHFGMYAWGQETGENYDLTIARDRFDAGVHDLVTKARGFEPAQILFPIGNDFFHINNPEGVTPSGGNRLDVDSRYQKVYEAGCLSLVRGIEYATSIAPVHLLWVPGNHDPQMSYHLCRFLSAWFRHDKRVTVDCGAQTRKYFRYGKTLLGFTHGNRENHARLPLLMATERAADYGEVTTREWHLGHYHRERETRFVAGDTDGDVIVRVLPSLSGTDAWHFQQGFVKTTKTAEAYVYERDAGLVSKFWTTAL